MSILCTVHNAFAWGERGHDIITRVAARQLVAQGNKELYPPFLRKEFMLGHLSNVPDIVWRADNRDEHERKINAPTHYINLEVLSKKPGSVFDIPTKYMKIESMAKKPRISLRENVGSAPWRVVQLHKMMRDSLEIAAQTKRKDKFTKHVNNALVYGGIMSHFVGDLANPHHTTSDHDGWKTGNGGLHAYFESYVVETLDPDLFNRVFDSAKKKSLIDKELLASYNEKQQREIKSDTLALTFALVINSYDHLEELVALDDQHSILKRSGKFAPAKRKPAKEVSQKYESFVVSRLALASAVLSHLWRLAWEQAGKPDLSSFHSFYYPVAPDFIYPDYLN